MACELYLYPYIILESSIDSTAIFTKLASALRRYVRVLSAEFRPTRLRNVEGAGRHSLMPLSKEELSLRLLSRKFKPARQRFVQHVLPNFMKI